MSRFCHYPLVPSDQPLVILEFVVLIETSAHSFWVKFMCLQDSIMSPKTTRDGDVKEL